jgi:hypothetical protein
VGLDVESAGRQTARDVLRLAKRRLTDSECALLAGGAPCNAMLGCRDAWIGAGSLGLRLGCVGAALKEELALCAKKPTPAAAAAAAAAPATPGEPDPARRAALFMQLWTLKEAFVKAKGVGISAPPGLKGFSIGGAPGARCSARALRA